jgi:ABC-type dipeptide/oligopeptide/nickel transport system ATPase component
MSNKNLLHENRGNNGLHIAIIGIDGSGKSSCYSNVLERVSQRKVAGIGDEVFISQKGKLIKPRMGYLNLKLFLGKRVKNIRNRTLYKILKLTELILRVKVQARVVKKYHPELILTDGSPLINTLAWGNYYLSDVYSEKLCSEVSGYMIGKNIPWSRKYFLIKKIPEIFLINFLRVKFQNPDVVFFLKVSPEVSLKRITVRSKKKQVHENIEFLQGLQQAYGIVCDVLKKNTEINSIDTDNKTIEEVTSIIRDRIYENN